MSLTILKTRILPMRFINVKSPNPSVEEKLLSTPVQSDKKLVFYNTDEEQTEKDNENEDNSFDKMTLFSEKNTQKISDNAGSGLPECTAEKHIFFGNYTRYVVLAVTTLCLSMIMSNSLALNFTIICMTPSNDDEILDNVEEMVTNATGNSASSLLLSVSSSSLNDENLVDMDTGSMYLFTRAEKSSLFSAIAVGTLIGTFPITFFTTKFGVRATFTAYGMISAVSTLLTPLCASLGFFPLFGMRVFQGIALSTSFPAMGSIIMHWSTLRNSGMYIALLSCHLQFGPIFTMPVAGELCESRWGWSAVYYLQGVMTVLSFIVFYAFFRDAPQFHRNVSVKELKTIQKGKNLEAENTNHNVPYKAMAKDLSVWGIFASNIGGNLGFQIFMQYGPIYLNKALKFNVHSTGFAAALPYILSALMKFIVGPFSDHFTFVSPRARVIIFATASQLSMACCFIALAFLPSDYPLLIQSCFTLTTVFSGLNCVGVAKSTQLMSRQFAHVLMALGAIVASVIVLLIPVLVAILAPNNTPAEWSRIFILITVIVVIATIIFDLTAEVDPRPWTFTASASSDANLLAKKSLAPHILTGIDEKGKSFSIDIDSDKINEKTPKEQRKFDDAA